VRAVGVFLQDGELIGDPTEGALVVLAAKGGIDAVSTRERYPRIAELPFDAAYKLMATFHEMTDASGREVIRCLSRARPISCWRGPQRCPAPTPRRCCG
jgi:Ca2+-transporting ATPase